MSNPSVSQNTKQTDPGLSDLLSLWKKNILLSLNCHALATIQAFDPATQTVSATINYKRTYSQRMADGTYRDVLRAYPPMTDVPVIVMQGGPAALTFPIQVGDTCLILFNDRDIDNWMQSGQVGPLASARLHDFSDAVALIGLRPFSKPLNDYDMNHALISWGETVVGVSETQVRLANAVESLNDIMQDLLTALESLTVSGVTAGGGVSGPPVNVADFIDIATRIGALLE